MKVVLLFALFAFSNGEYPAAAPEIASPSDSYGPPPSAPSDSYGPPPSAPSDSYGPPTKSLTKVSALPPPLPEIQSAPAPEPIVTETVAAAPAQSATFNFLSDLAGPSVVAVGLAENNVKTSPVIEQQTVSAPAIGEFQLNIPGLIPPITSIPLPPLVPPVQVLPPALFPPAQAPIPVPVQPVPVPSVPVQQVPVQPVPVQPLPLEAKTTTAPAQVTEFTTQIQQLPVQRIQSSFVPQNNHLNYLLSSSLPFHYAPYFFQSNTLPNSLFAKLLSQIGSNAQALPETLLNVQLQPATNLLESSVVNTTPISAAPATSYGTPAFEAIQKK